MQLRRDIILDLIYSILFAVVLIADNDSFTQTQTYLLFLFKNLILTGLLCLWIRSLASANASIFVIKDYPASKNSPFKSLYVLFRDFIQGKIACFCLLFCLDAFLLHLFNEKIQLINVYIEVLRISLIGFYVLFIVLITASYLKKSPAGIVVSIMALSPFVVWIILVAVVRNFNPTFIGVLPPNLTVLFSLPADFPEIVLSIGVSLVLLTLMLLFSIKSVKRLLTGTKYLKLDVTRMN